MYNLMKLIHELLFNANFRFCRIIRLTNWDKSEINSKVEKNVRRKFAKHNNYHESESSLSVYLLGAI